MESIDKILDTIEQEVNDGIEVGKRIQQKTFGLFTNPVFLLTFFTFIFVTIGYKVYHYYKREDDTRCATYNTDKKCPGYCVWDNEECSPKLKAGNACPDYWDTTSVITTGSDKNKDKITTITCTDTNDIYLKKSKCYSSKKKTKNNIIIKNGEIKLIDGSMESKCDWMKKCGPWDVKGISKFGCQVDSNTPNPKNDWTGWN